MCLIYCRFIIRERGIDFIIVTYYLELKVPLVCDKLRVSKTVRVYDKGGGVPNEVVDMFTKEANWEGKCSEDIALKAQFGFLWIWQGDKKKITE